MEAIHGHHYGRFFFVQLIDLLVQMLADSAFACTRGADNAEHYALVLAFCLLQKGLGSVK
jgi:hypothetical protein